MKIFLSHSSKDKSTVKEIKSNLSSLVQTWIDENELLVGKALEAQLERAVKKECDLVVLFLSNNSASSEWVKKEMCWAFEAEKRENRIILLPVLLDNIDDEKITQLLQDRVYFKCISQETEHLKSIARQIEKSVIKDKATSFL